MDELQKLYDVLVREGKYTKSFEEFQTKWGQDQVYKDKVYEVVSRDGLYTKDKNSFFQKYSAGGGLIPKPEEQPIAQPVQPITQPVEEPVDLKKNGLQDGFDFSQPVSKAPSVLTPKAQEKYIAEQEQKPVKIPVETAPKGVQTYQAPKELTEEDYFTGSFGNVLRGFDKIVPIGLGDFIDDMSRSVAAGYRQGSVAEEADRLLLQGAKASPEQIQKFIDANKNSQAIGSSAEMQDYQKIYEGEGKGFWGVVKGLANNPSIIPEVLTSSITAMATNTDALKAGAAAVGTGAGIGAVAGAPAGGVGAIPGAVAGSIASVPYAFGLASSVVEMGSTFGELLTEQLDGKEMTKENVKSILENPEKLNSIRNKAIARGAIIGTVDAFTGKLASGVGAKIIGRSAAKSATGAVTRGAVTKATAAGAAIEGAGGSLGEATARGVIGQDMDVSEIALEGLAELPGGIRSTLQARLAKPSYEVNGEKVSAKQVDELINTMSPADLAKTKIDIKNDYEGREFKIQDKIVTNSIKEQVRQGNPELNEPSLNAITQLEKDLKGLEGNTTQTGKDKAAAIRGQIKNIQENQLQEEAVAEVVVAEVPEVTQKRVDRIAEIETALSPESTVVIEDAEKTKLQTELETLKSEQDAIQKQTAGQVPVLTEAGVGEEVVQGEPKAEPQGVAQEGVQEEVIVQAPEITRESIRLLTDEEVNPLYDEIPMNLLPIADNVSKQDAVFEAYFKSKKKNTNPELVQAVETLLGKSQEVSLQTQTEEEQLARMEEMFAAQEIPQAPPVSQGASVTNKSALDQVKSNLKDTNKISIVDSAEKIITTLKSVLPNFDIVIHDNDDSYTSSMGSINAPTESAGNFSYVKMPDGSYVGRIDINLNKANQRTVAHEVAHGVMLKAFGENIETFKTFKNRIASVLNDSSNKELSDFASQYAENDSYEEYLAELTAKLEQQEGKLSASTLQKIAAIINELVSNITNGTFTPFQDTKDTKDAVEFFKNISESMRKGEAIKPSVVASKKSISKDTKADRKSKAQIIGNNAQLSATVKFNLDVAKDMSKNKMSPLDIRIQTGWEKGFEGKWRYEIPDGEFKDLDIDDLKRETSEDGTVVRTAKLSDVFSAPDLYQAYPDIKNIKVEFKDLPSNNYGSFNVSTKVITVNKNLYKKNKNEANLTMLHEMQHYIQTKELFEGGSNPSFAPIMMDFVVKDSKNKVNEQLKKYNDIKTFFPDDKNSIKNARELYKFTKERYSKINELLLHKDEKSIKNAYKDVGRRFNISDLPSENFLQNKNADGWNLYSRVAGEVEARNVEYRNKLTPEQRRRTLLSETENIDREDQILFENKELLFSEDVDNMNQKYPVSKSQLTDANKISKLIKDARTQGFSESVIETFLQRKGLNAEQISAAMGKVIPTAGKIDLSEEMLPGYTNLMDKIDFLIETGEKLKDLVRILKNSNEYINATDIQREKLVRELRKKLRLKEKSAPLVQKIIGAIKDVAKITMSEKDLLKKQIKDLARGAKDAKKLWRQVSGNLTKEIKELASSGKITAKQMASVLRKFSSVDMFNEKSIDKFVDYMVKVFGDAEYANKLEFARNMLGTAKKNIATKIGIADGLYASLNKLFSINPSMIPDSVLDKYLGLVDMFGKRQAVLDLKEKSQVKKETEEILNAIAEEQSIADELADRFNNSENKVFGDEGKLDFAESIKEMVKQGEITQEEADIMRKYKSDIMPQVESQKMTEEEIAEEKEGLIKEIEDADVVFSGLPTADERNLANRLKDLISTSAIDKLTNTELKNLLKVIGNINNNYLPHYAQIMVEKLNAINNAKSLTLAIKKAVIAPLSGLYSRVKSFVLRSKRTAISEMIRRNPLFNVDQLFGDFKTKDIFNAVLNKVSEGEARFKTDLKRVQNILEKAEEKVAKSFGLNANDTLMSKFKMMTYMIQLEYDSNQESKQVNPAAEYLKATIKHIDEGKSQFGERDANMLQEILDKYIDSEGNIDNDKLYKSFNEAEKSAIKDIRGVNESLREKAEYTAAIIRGDRINPLTNYVHLNVLHEHQPNDLTSGVAFVNDYNNAMRPSTKAKSLIERTGKVSPLNFDIFASAQRGAKFVLMDYNLTEPIRTARKTMKQTISNFEEEGRIPKEKREIINAIDSAFEEATENVLTNNFVSNSFGDDVADYIQKQGYRAVLAGTGRFVSELTSNIGFALIVDPKAFNTGIENRGFIMSVDAPLVMENVGSKQTNRVFPTDTLSGKLVDTNILKQASGIKGAKSKNPVANKIQQIWNLSGKKYVNTVELMADALISTPDKLMMRPMWFGSFANEFQNITGEKVNFDKIAANDESYMEQYKEAIEKSKTISDEKSVMAGSTDNAFMGILKGTTKPDQSVTTRAFNNFNNFMTKFLIFEYVTARTGINAAMGNGSLTKKQGVALLGAVTTRMVVYTLLTQMLGSGLMGLFFDDDEEETEKSFMQKLGQSLTSAFTSLILGRDFGNATKMIINEGVERANEKYLDFLREGDYDPYKDAIQYSIVPNEKKGRQTDLFDFFLNMGGSFGPALKTADFITRKAFEPEKKKEDAIERREKEINVRIPLEILGNAGLIPLYKDIRKSVMKDIYKDLEKAEKTLGDKKKIKAEKLQGYETESDMKRYDLQLWDRTFGQDAVDYDEVQAEKALKKAKDSLARAMKDDMYNYTPKTKGGFGSAGFGEKSKSKGGFGSAKFGGN